MTAKKTLLSPEEQWRRTIEYASHLHRREHKKWLQFLREIGPLNGEACTDEDRAHIARYEQALAAGLPDYDLWVVGMPHRLLSLGDVLLVTRPNGMVTRYGMTGVSSKGVRLNNYHIELRPYRARTVPLPGDLIHKRWDDPAIGRFVADLRASSRRRVGASIPAPIPLPPSGQPTQGLRFDGWYRSRRKPRHLRMQYLDRNYLRFFPDGTVISGPGIHYANWDLEGPWGTAGTYTVEEDALSITIEHKGEVVVRYEGRIDGPRLYLSGHCRRGWGGYHEDDIYILRPLGVH